MNESFAVIGLGRFGMALAISLANAGKEVIGIDMDEERVKEFRDYSDYAYVATSMSKKVLQEIGVQDCDVAIVCMGSQLETSILTTLNVIHLGVKEVIAKATNEAHGEILEKLGAQVVYPEHDMGERLASKLINKNLVDFIKLDSGIDISEVVIGKKMIGHSLIDLRVREKFHINIVGLIQGKKAIVDIDPNYQFQADDKVILIGQLKHIEKFINHYSGN
ncbi:MAG: TrkA family potassium uptake protein [Erysipelotrichaceae bacterium]|nr:TrkA family potassium uptake protein [Erysipelotrichaceae bacterium]